MTGRGGRLRWLAGVSGERGTALDGADLRPKLLWLIGLRAAVITILLGSAILVQVSAPGTFPVEPFFFAIGLTYALTALYVISLRFVARHRWMVSAQLVCDVAIVTAIIHVTGGITSYFTSLYFLPIVAAGIVQSRLGGLIVATLSGAGYASLVGAQYLGWFVDVPVVALPPHMVEYTVGMNVFGFILVAVLSGYLAESLRRADVRLERASNEIATLQAFNEDVIESLTSGLATTDREGRIMMFNRTASAITAHSSEAVIGRQIGDVMQLPPALVAALEITGDDREKCRAEYEYIRGDGPRVEIGISAAPLMTPGGQAGFLFNFRDVTESKRLDRSARLQQRLAAVGEMAAGIAHEIRNPLASMSGSIQILRQELDLTDEQTQLMDIVLRESDRLNETIRGFLAYARPQRTMAGRLDLRRVVKDAALLLQNNSEFGTGHVIDVDVPDTEVGLDADEGQVRQIVWNLATNGLRAMPTGGRLRLCAGREGEPPRGEMVTLSVEDEGVGIAAEDLDSIFQPFKGAFADGSGLGLAIVHRLVSDYHGEIQITSQVGAGTIVKVRLPARLMAGAA